MENQDYEKRQKLEAFSDESVAIAEEYSQSRYNFAVAKLKMDGRLADAYANKTIKESLAIDKAYIQLTINDLEAKVDYDTMIKEEQGYKGLEKLIDARQSKVSLSQSLIKTEAMMNK